MSTLDELKRRTDDVKRSAHGRWDLVFGVLVPQVRDALAKPGRHVTCPFHGGVNDFRVDRNFAETGRAICSCGKWDGFSLIMQANNWDFTRAVDEVADVLGGASRFSYVPAPVIPRASPEQQQRKDAKIKQNIAKWWRRTVPLTDPAARPARAYLKNRQVGEVRDPRALEDIGFHPSLEYYDGEGNLVGNFPALLSLVRMASGAVSTVHRTYLTVDGLKAPVEEPRKQYSSPKSHPVMGAAIRLGKTASPVLHVAEGLETALAVRALVGTEDPTWSTLNKELLAGLHVPDHVRILCVWADRDASHAGALAAMRLVERVRATGRTAVAFLPPAAIPDGKKGIDWNDMVAAYGLEGARNHFDVVRFMRSLAQKRKELGGGEVRGARIA